jgi:predicted acylesterase/phospholipase RssA
MAVVSRLAAKGERFDVVAGASSGSVTGCVTVAGLATLGPDMWRELAATPILSRRYLKSEGSPFGMSRILRGALERFVPEPLITDSETEFLVSTTRVRRFALEAIRQGTSYLREMPLGVRARWSPGSEPIAVTDVSESGIRRLAIHSGARVVHSNKLRRDIHDIIVASCTIPLIYARLPIIDGEIHVDGGAADNTLVGELIDRGADDITVISPYADGAVSATLFEDSRPPTVPPHVRLRLIWPERQLSIGRFDFRPGPLEEALTMPHIEKIIEPRSARAAAC